MQLLLSEADMALGRLDAATELLPNPDLFVAMYVRKEAVFSSQIEGTQASLTDLLEYEAEAARKDLPADVPDVVNYVRAMNYGLDRLQSLPLSLRLIREIHAELLRGVRGKELSPGEFRRSQNWIGPSGCSLAEALFVPPPPQEALAAMGDLEGFLHDPAPMPPLLKCGLAHGQFETIHPFLDGNGRVGRLLITLLLCWRGVLKRPLLYLSDYFKRHRDEYYQRLQAVREHGDWEGWIRFFLEGVKTVSLAATGTARQIQRMREEHRSIVSRELSKKAGSLVLLDHLFQQPILTVNQVARIIERTYPAAAELVSAFEKLGLLQETTGWKRNRVYAYQKYLKLFE